VYLILKQFLNAKAVVVGTDFRFGKNASGDINILSTLCNNAGIVCKIVDKISLDEKIISSSQIREYITTGNIEKANQMLGYNFFYFCKVITGNKIGRTLNFPTINQKIEPNKISPPFGVYLSSVEIEFKTYCGITNIGIKPTVGSNYPLCETYVDGFDGNLYDKIIKTSIIKKIRNEKKFDNLDQLKNQISIDCKIAKEYFKNI
ncbi:MAG: riboflavin kinase, partial [Oscillospiraceae bacterium]